MHVTVENTGDQAFNYVFPTSSLCYFTVDGIYYPGAELPVVVPVVLEPGESFSYSMMHLDPPLEDGPHILQAYLHTNPPIILGAPVTVFTGSQTTVTVGVGDERARVPVDFFWRTSLYECVFTADELNHTPGWITAITFYNNFSAESFTGQNVNVFLALADAQDLSQDWLPGVGLTQVSSGPTDFPLGENTITIPVEGGFFYPGDTSLGLAVHRPIHASYQFSGDPFKVDAADSLLSRLSVSDSYTLNPLAPPTPAPSQHFGFRPMTSFTMVPYTSEAADGFLVPTLSAYVYPNPGREGFSFKLDSSTPGSAQVEIFNLRGQLVSTIASGKEAGKHLLRWNAADNQGKRCPAGIYLCRMWLGSDCQARKLVLLP
jgi:hypothetical protein